MLEGTESSCNFMLRDVYRSILQKGGTPRHLGMSIDALPIPVHWWLLRHVRDSDKRALVEAGVLREAILSLCVEVELHEEIYPFPQWTSDNYSLGVRVFGRKLAVDGFDKLVGLLEVQNVLRPHLVHNLTWTQFETLQARFPWFTPKVKTIEWTTTKTLGSYGEAQVRSVLEVGPHLGLRQPLVDVQSIKEPRYQTVVFPEPKVRVTVHKDACSDGGGPPLHGSVDGTGLPPRNAQDLATISEQSCVGSASGVVASEYWEMTFSPEVTAIKLDYKPHLQRIHLRNCTRLHSLILEGSAYDFSLTITFPESLEILRIVGCYRLDSSIFPKRLKSLELTNAKLKGSFHHIPLLKNLRLMNVGMEENVMVLPEVDSFEVEVRSKTRFVLPNLLQTLGIKGYWPNLFFDENIVSADHFLDVTPLEMLKFITVHSYLHAQLSVLNFGTHVKEIRLSGLQISHLDVPEQVHRLHLVECNADKMEIAANSSLQEARFLDCYFGISPSHYPASLKVFICEDYGKAILDDKRKMWHFRYLSHWNDPSNIVVPPPESDVTHMSITTFCLSQIIPKLRVLKLIGEYDVKGFGDPKGPHMDTTSLEHLALQQMSEFSTSRTPLMANVKNTNVLKVLMVDASQLTIDFLDLPMTLETIWIHGGCGTLNHGSDLYRYTKLRVLVIGVCKPLISSKLVLPELLQDLSTNLDVDVFDWSLVSMTQRSNFLLLDKWKKGGWGCIKDFWCHPYHTYDESVSEVLDHLYPRPDMMFPPALHPHTESSDVPFFRETGFESIWRL